MGDTIELAVPFGSRYRRSLLGRPDNSPHLRLSSRGITLGEVEALSSRAWTNLTQGLSDGVGKMLEETTSLFEVHGEGETPRLLLVQEKACLTQTIAATSIITSDILRYWSLLTAEHRTSACFLGPELLELGLTEQGADLVTRAKIALDNDTGLRSVLRGFFHALWMPGTSVQAAWKLAMRRRQITDTSARNTTR